MTDPQLMELIQHACKEAALSSIDKEQILNAIVPPREWIEDRKRHRQLVYSYILNYLLAPISALKFLFITN